MKAIIALIVFVVAFGAIDEKYLDGRNTANALDAFRDAVRVINRYTDDLLRPFNR
jgi:hypothetical protein